MARWDRPGIPHKGWNYIGMYCMDDYTCMWNGVEDLYIRDTGEMLPPKFFYVLSSFGSFCYMKTPKAEGRTYRDGKNPHPCFRQPFPILQAGLRLRKAVKALKSSLFTGGEAHLPEKHIVSKIAFC